MKSGIFSIICLTHEQVHGPLNNRSRRWASNRRSLELSSLASDFVQGHSHAYRFQQEYWFAHSQVPFRSALMKPGNRRTESHNNFLLSYKIIFAKSMKAGTDVVEH